MSGTTEIITFSRRKKAVENNNKEPFKKSEQASRKKEGDLSPEIPGENNKLQVNDGKVSKGGKNPRWRRDNPAAYIINYQMLDQSNLNYVKEQFAQIDDFSLVIETPTPPRKPRFASVEFLHRYSQGFAKTVSDGMSNMMDSLKKSPYIPKAGIRNAFGQKQPSGITIFETDMPRRRSLHDLNVQQAVDSCLVQHQPLKPETPINHLEKTNERLREKILKENNMKSLALDKENEIYNDQDNKVIEEDLPATLLSQNLEKLTIDSDLEKLLELCSQKRIEHTPQMKKNSLPAMDTIIQKYVANLDGIQKIGEGTFGEVFKSNGMVIKVVPMEGSMLINGEPQKKAKDLLAETMVALTVSRLRSQATAGSSETNRENETSAFVETHEVKVCRGKYAKQLSLAWHSWKAEQGSENEDVDKFCSQQLFTVFIIANGGIDLEHFPVTRFAELQSILFQVVMALSIAEEACEFEHRDLHWGNILVAREQEKKIQYRYRGVDIHAQSLGLRVTLIDFSLSRVRTPSGEVAFCDLNADPLLFEGPSGNIQAEAYRSMESLTAGHWHEFTPNTNVIWLRYLIEMIIAHKMPENCARRDRALLRSFRKALNDATTVSDVLWSDLFQGLWNSHTPNNSN